MISGELVMAVHVLLLCTDISLKSMHLNAELKLDAGIEKKDLVKAMEGHIIAQGQLMGKYKKQ